MNTKSRRTGFTIIELLVSIGLFSILVSIAVGGFVRALRAQREVAALLAAQSNVSLALEQVAREMRTGYLFCHDTGSSVPSIGCGCAVAASPYIDLSAPGALPGGVLPIWTCNELNYFAADGTNVDYRLNAGTLERGVGGTFQPLTGANVSVRKLQFVLFGNTEGDNWNPRVTMSIGIAASSTDTAVSNSPLYLQTTVSGRGIDCTAAGPVQC